VFTKVIDCCLLLEVMEEGLLCLAEQSAAAGQYDAACAVFLHLLRSFPNDSDELHHRDRICFLLISALHDWGSESDRLDESSFQLLMKAYYESIELLPSSALLYNNLAGLLFRSVSLYWWCLCECKHGGIDCVHSQHCGHERWLFAINTGLFTI